jgi:hypothetical protein
LYLDYHYRTSKEICSYGAAEGVYRTQYGASQSLLEESEHEAEIHTRKSGVRPVSSCYRLVHLLLRCI